MKKLCVEFLHFWPWRPLVIAEKTPFFLYYAIQICYNHTQKDKFNPPNVMSNVLIQEHFSSHDCETDSNVTYCRRTTIQSDFDCNSSSAILNWIVLDCLSVLTTTAHCHYPLKKTKCTWFGFTIRGCTVECVLHCLLFNFNLCLTSQNLDVELNYKSHSSFSVLWR